LFKACRGNLDLGESLYPSVRQRHLLLDHLATEGLDPELLGSDVQPYGLTACDPCQRFSHRWIEVDICGSDCYRGSVNAIGKQIQSGVHPATC
jgi:hypothetical protein